MYGMNEQKNLIPTTTPTFSDKDSRSHSYGMLIYLKNLPQEVTWYIISLAIDHSLNYNYTFSKTLCKTKKEINALAVSPDGKTVLIGLHDKTASLWDLKTNEQRHEFLGHVDIITSVAFSFDGTMVVVGSLDTTATVWNATTGAMIKVFKGHRKGINSVACSPTDRHTVLTGSNDTTACLWDVQTGNQRVYFIGHTSPILSVAFSPDGSIIATGSREKIACLWNAQTGDQLFKLRGHSNFICSVAFISKGTIITSGSKETCTLDGTTLVTGSKDITSLWSVTTGKLLYNNKKLPLAVFSPDGCTIAVKSPDNRASLVDSASGEELIEMEDPTGIDLVAFSPNGTTFFTVVGNKTVYVWDHSVGFSEWIETRKESAWQLYKKFYLLNLYAEKIEKMDHPSKKESRSNNPH